MRDMLCSDWDELLDELQLSRAITRVEQSNISLLFTSYLTHADQSSSYGLWYYLYNSQSTIRSFRALLPKSGYSASEQEELRQQFTSYINQTSATISASYHFYTHIMQTIQSHIWNTNWLVRTLNSTEVASNVTLHVNGPLARSMKFFESCHMVYLLGGVEPFQEDVLRVNTIEAVYLIKAHVSDLSERLITDIDMIYSLQTKLTELAITLWRIQQHISRGSADSRKDFMQQYSTAWTHITKRLLGQFFSGYRLDIEQKRLDDVGPVFKSTTEFLYKAVTDLEGARESCLRLRKRLVLEDRLAKYGWDPSSWLIEQKKHLSVGIDDLELQLKNFKEANTRFDDRVFSREPRQKPTKEVFKSGF